MLGLDPDSWEAYQLDQVCLSFGLHIDNLLNQHDGKGRPIHRLEDLLNPSKTTAQAAARSARHLVHRKVRIGDGGTW